MLTRVTNCCEAPGQASATEQFISVPCQQYVSGFNLIGLQRNSTVEQLPIHIIH